MIRSVLSESWLDEWKLPDNLPANFEQLWQMHPDEHATVIIFGKETPIPRWQKSYGRDYQFSGKTAKASPVPDVLVPYLEWAEGLGYGKFNQILVNWYRDGNHYIGSHSDDEKQLAPDSPIVTITLCLPGTPRKFRIRNKGDKKIVKDVLTTNGMCLVMGGKFQKEYKHEIVKMTGAAAEKAGPRISITFRQFL